VYSFTSDLGANVIVETSRFNVSFSQYSFVEGFARMFHHAKLFALWKQTEDEWKILCLLSLGVREGLDASFVQADFS
jgi:hypothetical protein